MGWIVTENGEVRGDVHPLGVSTEKGEHRAWDFYHSLLDVGDAFIGKGGEGAVDEIVVAFGVRVREEFSERILLILVVVSAHGE